MIDSIAGSPLSFSVVVPVFNAEKDIRECVASLLSLDYPNVEIIVVDNGSTDNTAHVVAEHPVILVSEVRRGPTYARNTGLKQARGDVVAFMDADCVADSNWMKQLARHYKDPGVGGAGGRLLAYDPQNMVEEFLSFGDLRITHSKYTKVIQRERNRFLSGALGSANMSYRRNILEDIGGFNEALSHFGGDYDLCWRVQERGHKVIYDPEAVVRHKMRRDLGQLIVQFYGLGKGLPLLLKSQPGRSSYITIRSYFFPKREYRISGPLRFLVTLDFLFVTLIGSLLILVHPFLFFFFTALFCGILIAVMIKSAQIAKRSKRIRWLFLFPVFHFIRLCSETAGKIVGGIRTRVVAL